MSSTSYMQDVPNFIRQAPQAYQVLYPTQQSINNTYFPPQVYDTQLIQANQQGSKAQQYYYRMLLTSDGQQTEKETGTEIIWQEITKTKRTKINVNNTDQLTQNNKFSVLTEEKDNTDGESQTNLKIPQPISMFFYEVINYGEMSKNSAGTNDEEQNLTRCLANNIIKIN